MHIGFTGPWLVVNRLNDSAGFRDVIEAAFTGVVATNVLRTYEARTPCQWVFGCAWWQMVMGLAKPINAVVGHAGNFTVGFAELLHIVRTPLWLELLRAKKRRVADNDIGFGPLGGQAVGGDEGVGGNEVLVKVIQRQRRFGDVQFVNRQFAGDHHGDFGDFDGEGLDVKPVEVLGAQEAQYALAGLGAAGGFLHPLQQVGFEALEFAVGDVEEITGAAGGVEHAEIVQAVPQFDQTLEGLGALDLLAPGLDDGRADNFHDVGGVGEVGAEGVALFVTHRMLEEGAEYLGLDLGPIEVGGFAEQDQLLVVQFEPGRLGKKAAVEVGDVFEPSAVRGFAEVHGGEEAADKVVGVSGAVALVEEGGDEILLQQADVFGEEGHEHLQGEALGHEI